MTWPGSARPRWSILMIERRDTSRPPSGSRATRTSRLRPIVSPKRSMSWDVVMKRVPSLATQCGSMREAMKNKPPHTTIAPSAHSRSVIPIASVPHRRDVGSVGHCGNGGDGGPAMISGRAGRHRATASDPGRVDRHDRGSARGVVGGAGRRDGRRRRVARAVDAGGSPGARHRSRRWGIAASGGRRRTDVPTRLSEARPPGHRRPAPIVPLDDEPEPEPVVPAEPSDAAGDSSEAADEPAAAEKCEPSQQESAPTAHTSATEQQPEAP